MRHAIKKYKYSVCVGEANKVKNLIEDAKNIASMGERNKLIDAALKVADEAMARAEQILEEEEQHLSEHILHCGRNGEPCSPNLQIDFPKNIWRNPEREKGWNR